MQKITAFAIFSTRRLEEITRIYWIDLDARGSKVLIRGMKNPGEKDWKRCLVRPPAGGAPNHRLDAKGLDRRDFSLQHGCDRGGLHATCQFLGIMNLHFHDLRHDGVSRLFETGLTIPQVGSVSGHRAWSSLKRYTHLRQTGDKYADWKWLSVVASADREIAPLRSHLRKQAAYHCPPKAEVTGSNLLSGAPMELIYYSTTYP